MTRPGDVEPSTAADACDVIGQGLIRRRDDDDDGRTTTTTTTTDGTGGPERGGSRARDVARPGDVEQFTVTDARHVGHDPTVVACRRR